MTRESAKAVCGEGLVRIKLRVEPTELTAGYCELYMYKNSALVLPSTQPSNLIQVAKLRSSIKPLHISK